MMLEEISYYLPFHVIAAHNPVRGTMEPLVSRCDFSALNEEGGRI